MKPTSQTKAIQARMAERAARGSKAKALAALEAIRKADRPLPTEDQLTASREKPRRSPRPARSRQA